MCENHPRCELSLSQISLSHSARATLHGTQQKRRLLIIFSFVVFRVTLHAQNDLAKFDLEKVRNAGGFRTSQGPHKRRCHRSRCASADKSRIAARRLTACLHTLEQALPLLASGSGSSQKEWSLTGAYGDGSTQESTQTVSKKSPKTVID